VRRPAELVVRALLLAALPVVCVHGQNADAQTTARAEDVMIRIRRMTSADVSGARQLADSLVSALPAGASVLPEALFSKASIAASAADAERDYTRIVDEHRFAPRVPDALMRLALLENARNNRTGALRHLDRLLRDHGDAPVRSRASLLAGQIRMDARDPARACDLLAAAYASASAAESDVRDQAELVGQKCPTPVSRMATSGPAPMGVVRGVRDPQTAAPRPVSAPRVATAPPPSAGPPSPAPPSQPVSRPPTASSPVASPPAPQPAPQAPTAAPSVLVTSAPVTPAPARVPPPSVTSSPVTSSPVTTAPVSAPFAVQFAAYNDRPGAAQFAAVLRERGIAARVEGTSAPFRVRAGRFSSRAEAEAAAALWRRPGQAAIVVATAPQP
jgi:hypothetical protein